MPWTRVSDRGVVHAADRRGQAITASHVSTPKWTVMPLRP